MIVFFIYSVTLFLLSLNNDFNYIHKYLYGGKYVATKGNCMEGVGISSYNTYNMPFN